MDSPYQFNYTQQGDKEKPALLFLHGFMGSAADWSGIVNSFSNEYLSIAVDLPGHGKTVVMGGAEKYKMENCATGLICLMDELKVNKCSLVGYSMGGRLALYLAVHFPDRFGKVVIESASAGLKTKQERQARVTHDEKLAHRLEADSFEEFLREWYDQPLFASLRKDAGRFRKLLESRLNNDKAGLGLSLRVMGSGSQPSLWEELCKVGVPLLLIVGEKDDKFLKIGREMAAECKTASLSIVSNAGHNVHFDNPEEYVNQVSLFLKNKCEVNYDNS